ncbi:uncharacterized protein LOC142590269 isoform X3 [Dermacentor variabilis]|uniref:uncharacterized protein LOC142590269 isoform X3 n=1 Tax=Dermacentor variabilis TaxID=34621 RepID=UPI003F5C9EF4
MHVTGIGGSLTVRRFGTCVAISKSWLMIMTEESELELDTEVSKPERNFKKPLLIIAAVVCAALLIAIVAGAFWTMSGGDEPVDDQGSGEDVTPASYPSGGNYKGQTTPADVIPNGAPKTLPPPPPNTTGTERPKAKVTNHKRLPSSQGPSSTSSRALRNRTLSTTPAVVYKRTTSTIAKTPSTTVPTPRTTLPSSTTTSTTVPPRLPLVCTVMDYPSGLADNICDHLFYDSLYRDIQSAFIGITDMVKTFVEAAATSNLTRFGFSIEVSELKTFSSEFKSSDGQKYWKQYLEKRVYDWGFLNVNERHFQDNPDVLKEALAMMKKMDEYQKQQTPIQAYMMLGVFFMPTLCDQVAQNFKTIFLPAHVILLGQISYGSNRPCVALPANNYIDPRQEKKNLTHGHTLRQATESAKCLQTKGINTSYSVSIEMESMQFHHGPGSVRAPADKQLYTGCSSSDSYQRLSLPVVPSTSRCLSTPAEAVEPPAHGEGSHVEGAVSQVFAPSAADCHNVFRRAMQEPSSLSTDDLKLLAVAICQSAIRRANYAIPAAEFCLAIIERGERAQAEGCETFLESLLLFCRELFNSRDEVLRPPDQPTVRSRRWVAYVTFLAELLDGLSEGLGENTLRPCRGGAASMAKARSMMVLATLLCVSCHTILQPPSLYNPTEMDCLRTALTTAGAALERVAPERLAALLREIHATLEMQGLPIRSRHVLLELKELQAAGWQLSPAQQPDLPSGTGR